MPRKKTVAQLDREVLKTNDRYAPLFARRIPRADVEVAPEDEAELLTWLSAEEDEHWAQIDEAWQTILPPRKTPR